MEASVERVQEMALAATDSRHEPDTLPDGFGGICGGRRAIAHAFL
jgi:hypothetical protein